MTTSALTALRALLPRLNRTQSRDYYARVEAWARELRQVLPDEAKLYLAQCVRDRTQPNPRRLREIVAWFGGPPRPAA